MNYVRYITATGEIVGQGEGPKEMFDAPPQQPGTALLEAVGDSRTHYVVGGVLTAYTTAEAAALGSLAPGFIWQMPQRVAVDARSLANAKDMKLAQILARCNATLQPITAGYPESEQKTWDKQETEARQYTASNTAPTPLLSALSAARGVSVPILAARVIAKADAFAGACGQAIGKRQKHEDEVAAATTIAAVDAIIW
jgi:hypothetical protein